MRDYFIRSVLLCLFSYMLLGNVEEIVLLGAILLFVGLFVSKLQEFVLLNFQSNLVELEKFYSFFFSLQQTRIYIRYFFLLKLKQYLFFFFVSTLSFTRITLC